MKPQAHPAVELNPRFRLICGLENALGAQWPLDESQKFNPVFVNQGVVAAPVAVRPERVDQLAHLIELFAVGVREDAANHGIAVGAHHGFQNVNKPVAGQFEMAGVN